MYDTPRVLVPHAASDRILRFLTGFSILMILLSLVIAPIDTVLTGLYRICVTPMRLMTDACVIGGTNGALLNAGLIGLISVAIYYFAGVALDGRHIGTYFHAVGISFFGKNILNFWPLIVGVYLYARYKKEPFKNHAHTALFAGALSACVSEIAFSSYLNLPLAVSAPLAVAAGVLLGFVIVPLSAHTQRMHRGYNLYNMGLAAGLVAFVAYSIYRTFVLTPLGVTESATLNAHLLDDHAPALVTFFGLLFAYCLVRGFLMNGKSFRGYGKLLNTTGYHEDYLAEFGLPLVLINFGLLGLMSLLYFLLVGAQFTGLTIGSIACLVCWCALGSTPKNVFPILCGYTLVSFFATWSLNSQLICIGLCFATGLAPIAGRYGFLAGLAAGALHACCVSYTAAFHGGFNLYNGGFTSGLVAIVLVPVLGALKKPRENPVEPVSAEVGVAEAAPAAEAGDANASDSVTLE